MISKKQSKFLMKNSIKILSTNILINFTLFFLMIFCIQNSSTKKSIELLSLKTIPLPISFLVGSSFILGSLNGGLIVNQFRRNKN